MSTKKTGVPCYDKAAEDEPLFVIRAQSKNAPEYVLMWANQARVMGVNEEKVAGALRWPWRFAPDGFGLRFRAGRWSVNGVGTRFHARRIFGRGPMIRFGNLQRFTRCVLRRGLCGKI